jgi:hypothetical protein
MVDLDRRVGSNTLGLGGPKARPHQKTATPPLARCEPGKPAVRTNHNFSNTVCFWLSNHIPLLFLAYRVRVGDICEMYLGDRRTLRTDTTVTRVYEVLYGDGRRDSAAMAA